jgi:hypothetical protein
MMGTRLSKERHKSAVDRTLERIMAQAFDSIEESDFDPQQYRPSCARDAEKLLLLGATREDLAKWFGVHKFFLDHWEDQHEDFALAMQTKLSRLGVGYNDYGLYKWLYDYRRGAMR